ncbi:hypothetical protein [Microbacterium allomyrinae]|uniref:DUF2029 domain-containing protein n=1 Tax=Microbacterium allomyrinae TaxID=2830666 RepID=A0A9X1S385_9MICO|nr:hypothetical protein [Microbacterium allomyrinae]MCC2033476.1 DUF2029 domain-containing protein [Microbacterium allomyrinae]
MSRRGWLWIAFVVIHVAVAALGFVLPNIPMGDVYLVYEPWARDAVGGGGIPGVSWQWVYPQLAIVPMVLALGFAWIAGSYTIGWAILVTLADALAFALLVGRGRSKGRTLAAIFWLAFILLLGPVGMYRLDGFTVPLALAGCLWLAGRPLIASLLLSAATWMKVWPAALLAAAVIAMRRRLVVVAGALIVTGITVVAVVIAGGGSHVFGFVAGQTGRGLQVEAPVSAFFLWQVVAGAPGALVYYDRDILTFQVAGAGVDAVIAVMTPLLAIAVLGVAALGAVKAWRGAGFAALFPPLAFSLVLAFIVFNKVGSPQFLTWLVAPIAMGLVFDRHRWSWPAAGALAAALLTQLVYPVLYNAVILADSLAVSVLTLRNLVMIALFAWAVVRLARVPGRSRHASLVI